MNTKFVFDKETGTMQPVKNQLLNGNGQEAEVKLNEKTVDDGKLELLSRYANELGLDGILLFRQQADCTICQITDENTGKIMAYISGYALNIKFNMEQLNSVAKVEQCLEGIKKLFRSFIVQQAIENK